MESHKILFMFSGDAEVLAVHGDEKSHEEASERVSTVPGRDRAGGFQETLADPSQCNTMGWKSFGRVSRDNTKARELILEKDLAKNVSLSLHNSFCLNRESEVKGLPNQAKRLQDQKQWMQAYEQLKALEEIVSSSDDEKQLARQITVSSGSGPSTSKTMGTK